MVPGAVWRHERSLAIAGARRFISREHGGVANSGTTLAAMQQDEAGGEMQLLIGIGGGGR